MPNILAAALVLILWIALFGVIVWLILRIPQIAPFREVIIAVAIIVVILFVISTVSSGGLGPTVLPARR